MGKGGSFSVNLVGADLIVSDFKSLKFTVHQAAVHIVTVSGALLLHAIKSAASGPLKPSDLSAMDHPYAKRHPGISSSAPKNEDGIFMINKQTGALRNAINGQLKAGFSPRFDVTVDQGMAPYAGYVMLGTAKMHGRPIIQQIASSPGLQRKIRKAAIRLLGKTMKSKSKIRFIPKR